MSSLRTKTGRKKICFLKRDLNASGGLEKYTARLSKAFVDRGHQVHFISANQAPDPYTSHIVPSRGLLSFQKIGSYDKHCSDLIKKMDFDIVFGMDRNSSQTHIRAGNGVHRAFLARRSLFDRPIKRLTHRLNPLNQVILKIEKEAFENRELIKIFTNSEMVRREILTYYNADPEKVSVIHNGVEWSEMQSAFDSWAEKKWDNASNLNLDPHTFHFLFVGHGYKRKGLEPLLCALSLIRHLNFHLSVVGSDRNIDHFKQLAITLGLENRVTFFGPQKSLLPFYQLADCTLIPSYYDPFANVTVESLAMGVFVISSTSNGGHEVLTSENGLTFPPLDDIDGMSDTLMSVLHKFKTAHSSRIIRNSVAYLDYSHQLEKYVQECLD